jgi:hypothetical protein
MVCNSCKNEFENIDGLKFCPYCGTKLEEITVSKAEEAASVETKEQVASAKTIEDTLRMPVITKEQIRKYKMEKFLSSLIKPFKNYKLVISIITVVFFTLMVGAGYVYSSGKPVDEAKIKNDLIGKTIVLPKGTSFEIKKGSIRSFSVSERKTSKSEKKDDIKAVVTLDNSVIEAKTVLAIQYIYNENKKWIPSEKLELTGDTTIKPLVGMEDNKIIEEAKKLTINIGDVEKILSDKDVKTLNIASRTPDFDNLKETVLLDAGIDSGLIAASGKIKCILSFENEAWAVSSIVRNSTEDFAVVLSPAFSQEKVDELIKKVPLEQTISHADVFGGKNFFINESFTKSIALGEKKFDAQSRSLTVNVKRQNAAGEVKTVLSTDYTFTVGFDKIELLKKSKTTADSVTINDISKDYIGSTIVGAELEGNNAFLWFSDNHKITSEEAKTFKTTKTASKKGAENIKYVYGSLTYKDGSKTKTTNVVAVYFLVYDKSKGYSWKLDKIVSEDSPSYKLYKIE